MCASGRNCLNEFAAIQKLCDSTMWQKFLKVWAMNGGSQIAVQVIGHFVNTAVCRSRYRAIEPYVKETYVKIIIDMLGEEEGV